VRFNGAIEMPLSDMLAVLNSLVAVSRAWINGLTSFCFKRWLPANFSRRGLLSDGLAALGDFDRGLGAPAEVGFAALKFPISTVTLLACVAEALGRVGDFSRIGEVARGAGAAFLTGLLLLVFDVVRVLIEEASDAVLPPEERTLFASLISLSSILRASRASACSATIFSSAATRSSIEPTEKKTLTFFTTANRTVGAAVERVC
jgi:hypothetical protein